MRNSDFDTFACLAGDPNTLGEPCLVDTQCADPLLPDDPNAICGGPTGNAECDVDNPCPLHPYWERIRATYEEMISQTTVADLGGPAGRRT